MSNRDYIRLGFKAPFVTNNVFKFIYDQNASLYPIAKIFSGAGNHALTQINLLLNDQIIRINSTPNEVHVVDKDIIQLRLNDLDEKSASLAFNRAIGKAIEKLEEANQSITVFIQTINSSVFVALNLKKGDNLRVLKDKFFEATGRKVTSMVIKGASLPADAIDDKVLKVLGVYNGMIFEVEHDGAPLAWKELPINQDFNSSIEEKRQNTSNSIPADQEEVSSTSSSRVFGNISITSLLGPENDEDGDIIMGNTDGAISTENDTTNVINDTNSTRNSDLDSTEQVYQSLRVETPKGITKASKEGNTVSESTNIEIPNRSRTEAQRKNQNSQTPDNQNHSSIPKDAPLNETSLADDSTEFPAANQQSIQKELVDENLIPNKTAQTVLENSQSWTQQNKSEDSASNTQASMINNIGTPKSQPNGVETYNFKVIGSAIADSYSFSLKKDHTFKLILKEFRNRYPEHTDATFNFLRRVIEPNDSPGSIGASKNQLNELDVIFAGPELVTFVITDTTNTFKSVYLKAKLKIKLKKVFEIYASKNKLNWKELKFNLNGKTLEHQETLSSAGLQNGSKVEAILP